MKLVPLLIIALPSLLLLFWLYRIIRLFWRKRYKRAWIHVVILLGLTFWSTWRTGLFPGAQMVGRRQGMEDLTGHKFWSREEFGFEDYVMLGEDYRFHVFRYSEETAAYFVDPPPSFFAEFPAIDLADIRWQKTPVPTSDQEMLDFVLPNHTDWTDELEPWQTHVREEAIKEGGYYAYTQDNAILFYLILPNTREIVVIYYRT